MNFFLLKLSQLSLIIILIFSLLPLGAVQADKTKIEELEQKLAQTQTAAKSLKSEITKLDTQAELTSLKITQTEASLAKLEEEIGVLGGRIDRIRGTLTTQSDKVLIRISNTYKNGQVSPLDLFLSTNDFGKFLTRYKYLKTIQQSDRKVLGQLQTTKSSYTNQKETLEDKKVEVEKLKVSLTALQATLIRQKKEKESLLVITKNDERTYQAQLAQARAEQAAISFGKLTLIRDVKAGDTIGNIINGASGCSSGAHLHFEVHKNGSVEDPNNYLKNTSFSYNYPPDKYDDYGTIHPNGPLEWPVNNPIEINQGYGSSHYYARRYDGGIHAGIDMDGGGSTVKAIKEGKLYGGSYSCGGAYPGTLTFAKVVHNDGLETYYLHIYPQ